MSLPRLRPGWPAICTNARLGTGVVPDVAAKSDDAAAVAYRLALDSMINSTTDGARKAELRGINVEQALRKLAQ